MIYLLNPNALMAVSRAGGRSEADRFFPAHFLERGSI